MKRLKEIGRETYGHNARAINLHSERLYEDEKGNRYILSRCLDGVPPFFEAYGPFRDGHEGLLPRLKVFGREYWGDGWAWRRVLHAFCKELKVVVDRPSGRKATADG